MSKPNYPVGTEFTSAPDQPNMAAHKWLGEILDTLDWDAAQIWPWDERSALQPALRLLYEQPPEFQISILKACLERMDWHKHQKSAEEHSIHYYVGSVLYSLACTLYRRKLPFSERDVCDILSLSRHCCGHGGDVTPPVEIAVTYAKKFGVTPNLLTALRRFISGLKGVNSSQASHLKRKAGLLLVLDANSVEANKPCWSDRFRDGLQALPFAEQGQWQRLVVQMTINDLYVPSKAWRREANGFLNELGSSLVVERLSGWWPDPTLQRLWPIQTGGSHLLKYFIWLLTLIADNDRLKPKCIHLVSQLSLLDWKPRERGQKVMIAAACYLAEFEPEVSWPALQRIATWSALTPDGLKVGKIRECVEKYKARHVLVMPSNV